MKTVQKHSKLLKAQETDHGQTEQYASKEEFTKWNK